MIWARGKFFAQQPRHLGIPFDGDEPVFAQAAFDERLGDRAGAGAEFEHVTFRIGRQPVRHGRRELG